MKWLIVILLAVVTAHADSIEDDELDKDSDVVTIVDSPVPGAASQITKEALENRESNDIHQVLQAPGVYVRQEEGFGLRPNIGIRGTSSERSSKITLMEDGVLIAPAPYSAPAAYYFPMVTRMTGIDIMKGPGAIRFGPSTVGGAINLHSAPIPHKHAASLDLATGNFGFTKQHARLALVSGNYSALLEGVQLSSQGIKELDNGGATGFLKSEFVTKLRYENAVSESFFHSLTLRLGYADELSRETYLGISEQDLRETPNRRYRASHLGEMTWKHQRVTLDYQFEGNSYRGDMQAYGNFFTRKWTKFDDFAGSTSVSEVLAAPQGGINQALYAVLTGQADSQGGIDELLIGTNDRKFISTGLQGKIRKDLASIALLKDRGTHQLEMGTRFHFDRITRDQFQNTFEMTNGSLVDTGRAKDQNTDSVSEAFALSAYTELQSTWNSRLITTVGVRGELVRNKLADNLTSQSNKDVYGGIMPGGGAVFRMSDNISLLGSVYWGFAPTPPRLTEITAPERSRNYEVGFRAGLADISVETIAFFNDYKNLTGNCSISSGCAPQDLGRTFDGGRVWTWGVENQLSGFLIKNRRIQIPIKLLHTYTDSSFRQGFVSANPIWGNVAKGDRLPYIPKNNVVISTGITHAKLGVILDGSFTSAMLDSAGTQGLSTDDTYNLDGSAWYSPSKFSKIYLRVDNITGTQYLVSYRPFGARPSKPRMIQAGIKFSL